jgi:hypothetical protein
MLCGPSSRADAVICQVPVAVATLLPICVVPSNRVIARPAVAVPLKVGAKTLVMLSAVDLPLSDVAIRSGTDGAGGGATIETDRTLDAVLTLPARSVAVALMV